MWTLHGMSVDGTDQEEIIDLAGGLRMKVDTLELVQRTIFLIGYEPEPVALVRRHLVSGFSAIDVGAHVGAITLVMAQAVRHGTVLACEPNPQLAVRLAENIALSGLNNVLVRQVAVGAHSGWAALQVPTDRRHVGGSSLAAGDHTHHHATETLIVPMLTLDELVAESGLRKVALVKIDVEGFEAAVLSGGRHLLERDRPSLIFEYTGPWWTACGASLEGVTDMLSDLGYRHFAQVHWRGLRPIPSPLPTQMNVFAN
jgi:FkbM family methyltransferase